MAKKAFEKIMGGLVDAKEYLDGERHGFVEHAPVDIKAIRKRASMSQAQFAKAYHLPLGTVKDWEQARRQPDAPARALLTLIERAPEETMRLLAEA